VYPRGKVASAIAEKRKSPDVPEHLRKISGKLQGSHSWDTSGES
jgi:hypothetical protein